MLEKEEKKLKKTQHVVGNSRRNGFRDILVILDNNSGLSVMIRMTRQNQKRAAAEDFESHPGTLAW